MHAHAWCRYCVETAQFRGVAGPGGWHDPDMLLVGQTNCSRQATANGMHCGALTHDEEELQMARKKKEGGEQSGCWQLPRFC